MHPPVESDPWLTTADVEALTQFGRKTIYKAIRRKKLRAAQTEANGDYRFKRSWVDAWLEAAAEPTEIT